MPGAKIAIRNLYKIFGPRDREMVARVKGGTGKRDLLENHAHVLGLQDINVDMQPGEITVIMGLSGSGKSTLIRHLNRLIEPSAGEVLVDGQDVLKLGPAELQKLRRKTMSMVFQKFALLPHRTVAQNAAMPLFVQGAPEGMRVREAEKWLQRVGLGGYGDRYPSQLSGGMQQRVGIARALAANTDIMLMDEAFSALDPLIRTDMQDLLLELQRELHKTIVFITHDLDEALKLADHLVILNDGAVVQQGDPQHILLNPADPYIEDFVSDINRARVLRVRSIATPVQAARFDGEVEADANLESLIATSDGDTARIYRVRDNGEIIGQVDMKDLVKALVPSVRTEKGEK
ncbi:betaine/proline/choline family ABC transporter ATP-binding protein [Roseibacterium sp. SDUM158016]|jgi:glycine betaine/proline transport system ATP-binding protein|uniref:quaternary amine ABC transporter ATP-binding protein n=1 Tax=Roseicyclus sediminis TaxID=2980997 RepID=UPI0021D35D49|nr:betaine/proline/choline family ABC transporter ATP-binding protein [Roseibacterium sp. SDUM158016]MCU4652649.1 betaine/proline/choline family ABC transporter ATP-binding protein [Roseibacterium sp. SDUM158016]